jgi:RHS repeat-associated protein
MLQMETRPDGAQIAFVYDFADRLKTITHPQGLVSLTYDNSATPTGHLLSIQNTVTDGLTPETLSFTYDGVLPTGTTWSGSVAGSLGVTYDNFFRVTQQTLNGSSTLTFGYDNDDLLTQAGALTIARDTSNALVNSPPKNGRITGTTLGNVTDALAYDGNGDFQQYRATSGSTLLYSEFIGVRDQVGRILQRTETIGTAPPVYWNYAYDGAGRLASVTSGTAAAGFTVAQYSYDADDNRIGYDLSEAQTASASGTYDAQDRMTAYGPTGAQTSYVYGANGELQSKTDASGNTTSYVYDVFGNLLHVTLPGGSTQIDYIVDGQNRRVGKIVNGQLAQGFLYQNQLNPVAQLDGSGNVVSRFVYGTRANVPDYLVSSDTAKTYRIVSDHLGSPRLVVDTSNGNVAEQIDYDEYGNVTSDQEFSTYSLDTSLPIPFGFAGGLRDLQTGLVRFGARDYDPTTGRWTSKDPARFGGQQINFYEYVGNDPVNRADPNGLVSITISLYVLGGGQITLGWDPSGFYAIAGAGLGIGAGFNVDPLGSFPRPNSGAQSGLAACVGGAAEVGGSLGPLSGGYGSGELFTAASGPGGVQAGAVDTTGGSIGATKGAGLGADFNAGFRVGIGGFGPGLPY